MPDFRRVVIIPYLAGELGRQIVRGIQQYARPTRPWVMRHTMQRDWAPDAIRNWRPHGVLAHVGWDSLREAINTLGVPIVNTSGSAAGMQLPTVTADNVEAGRMAAKHLIDRRFKQFAFSGGTHSRFAAERHAGFCQVLEAEGFNCDTVPGHGANRRTRVGEPLSEPDVEVRRWLSNAPKPLAIYCADDGNAILVAETVRQLGYKIPEEIAMLGTNNDELLCRFALPPVSSVELPGELIGYEAAKLLDAIMDGQAAPDEPLLLEPVHVVTRQSTDIMAIEDPQVAEALRFIREHAHERIKVADVLRRVPMSRSTLERRFTRMVGRTPLDEIHRVQLEHAKHYLASTDKPMPQVATASGFRDNQHLTTVFRRLASMTPTAYRRRSRIT